MKEKAEKVAASIAAQMAEEFREFYFKNGNPRKMRAFCGILIGERCVYENIHG